MFNILIKFNNNWFQSLITLVILWYIAFIFCGTFIGFYLSKENNKWGILLSSISLPIIGTIISLIIIQKKYKIFNKWFKKNKKDI